MDSIKLIEMEPFGGEELKGGIHVYDALPKQVRFAIAKDTALKESDSQRDLMVIDKPIREELLVRARSDAGLQVVMLAASVTDKHHPHTPPRDTERQERIKRVMFVSRVVILGAAVALLHAIFLAGYNLPIKNEAGVIRAAAQALFAIAAGAIGFASLIRLQEVWRKISMGLHGHVSNLARQSENRGFAAGRWLPWPRGNNYIHSHYK